MFPKKIRLPLGKEKLRWQKNFSSPHFLVRTRENSEGHNRFAIIIAVSSVKKSTRRHFWKRQFAARLQMWPNLKKDFLIIVSPGIESADKKMINNELQKSLEKLKN